MFSEQHRTGLWYKRHHIFLTVSCWLHTTSQLHPPSNENAGQLWRHHLYCTEIMIPASLSSSNAACYISAEKREKSFHKTTCIVGIEYRWQLPFCWNFFIKGLASARIIILLMSTCRYSELNGKLDLWPMLNFLLLIHDSGPSYNLPYNLPTLSTNA